VVFVFATSEYKTALAFNDGGSVVVCQQNLLCPNKEGNLETLAAGVTELTQLFR